MHDEDKFNLLVNSLLAAHEDNVAIKDLLRRIASALERDSAENGDAAGTIAALLPQVYTALTGVNSELSALKALLPAIQAATVEGGKDLAVLSNNVRDVQVELRESSRKFQHYDPSGDGEVTTERTVGKITITVWRHARRFWPLVAASGAGAAIMHALRVLHILK